VTFDAFVGIDWSGAAGNYQGVAVAMCGPDRSAPRLVPPPAGSRHWRRAAVRDWLLDQSTGTRLLVGIDCAFSLPFDRAAGYFEHEATAPDLWALVDRVCAGDADLLGTGFVVAPGFGGGFWRTGTRDPAFVLPQRGTERACRADGLGMPESPYKLIGPRQVGKGTLAGMRLLHALTTQAGERIAVWPFQSADDGRTVVVEIYPRLFLRRTGYGNLKVRTWAGLERTLTALGCEPGNAADQDPSRPLTDHETDALVSAAGLRLLASQPETWAPPAMNARARRQEGWIFGVGLPRH